MRNPTKFITGLIGFVTASLSMAQGSEGAPAAAYPEKPIRIIVPYPAGGGGDAVFRLITEPLAVRIGKPVLLEHRAGAGGTIGLEALTRSVADGYTLGVGSSDAVALAPNFYPKLGYSPLRDLQPLFIVAEMPLVLLVKADSPIRSFEDLLRRARESPGSVTYGTPGKGSSPHLVGELLARQAGIDLLHVPYKGTAPALVDLQGGHVSMVITSGFDSVPLEKAGRVRTIAVTGTKRYPLLPETPTMREHGIDSVDELKVWFGLFSPTGIASSTLARLAKEIDAIVAREEFRARSAELGFVPIRATPDQFKEQVRGDIERFAEMVNRTGVKPEQ